MKEVPRGKSKTHTASELALSTSSPALWEADSAAELAAAAGSTEVVETIVAVAVSTAVVETMAEVATSTVSETEEAAEAMADEAETEMEDAAPSITEAHCWGSAKRDREISESVHRCIEFLGGRTYCKAKAWASTN